MSSGATAASFNNPTCSPLSGRQAPPQAAQAACRTVFPTIAKATVGYFSSSERVSIYIDGLNFYYGLRTIRNTYTDFRFDFARFIKKILRRRELIKAYYYNASLKRQIDPLIYKRQRVFFSRLRTIENFRVVLCKRQRRVSKEGKEYYTIKGDDIHLAIDMLKDAYENQYDTAILISGDGDFAPLVRQVKQRGKRVENCHFADNVSRALMKACDESRVIDKKTANRFFLREEKS